MNFSHCRSLRHSSLLLPVFALSLGLNGWKDPVMHEIMKESGINAMMILFVPRVIDHGNGSRPGWDGAKLRGLEWFHTPCRQRIGEMRIQALSTNYNVPEINRWIKGGRVWPKINWKLIEKSFTNVDFTGNVFNLTGTLSAGSEGCGADNPKLLCLLIIEPKTETNEYSVGLSQTIWKSFH